METLLELNKKFPMAGEYLLTIFLIERDYRHVSNSQLAKRIGVSRPAVTQALGRLKKLELVQSHDHNISLTDNGQLYAKSLLRRHYLVEHLLVNTLNYPWDKADEEARLLQDKISPDFTEFLYEKMGQPKSCPHGNPFPDTPVEGRLLGARELSRFSLGSCLRVMRVTEEGEDIPGLLKACFTHHIRPGSKLKVLSKESDNLELEDLETGNRFSLQLMFADFIRGEIWDNQEG